MHRPSKTSAPAICPVCDGGRTAASHRPLAAPGRPDPEAALLSVVLAQDSYANESLKLVPTLRRVAKEAGGDGVMLKQGDRVRLTQSAVVLENLISQFLFNKAAETKEPAK